jgi:MoxR-like ATPase
MEGKSYYVKKTGQMVHPAKGFTIIATANTKGQGADDGKYLSQIMDAAFLNRFVITVEQEFPDVKIEKKILTPLINDEDFVNNLVQWSDVIRKSYVDGAIDEVISTRELVHIAKTFLIFKDKMEAIELVIAKHVEEVKLSLMDLYSKIDSSVESPANTSPIVTSVEI